MIEPTPREREILDLLAEDGDSWTNIAAELHMSPKTVRTHAGHLFVKYEAHNRTQLLVRYLRREGRLT